MNLKIETLGKHHNRNAFECEEPVLNTYLYRMAGQHATRGVARTRVVVDVANPSVILAFYSLCPCEVPPPAGLPGLKKYPHNVPAMRLTRIARDTRYRGERLGEIALLDAIRLTVRAYELVGGIGLFVDAKNERVARYYEEYGFLPIPERELMLFLPIQECVKVLTILG